MENDPMNLGGDEPQSHAVEVASGDEQAADQAGGDELLPMLESDEEGHDGEEGGDDEDGGGSSLADSLEASEAESSEEEEDEEEEEDRGRAEREARDLNRQRLAAGPGNAAARLRGWEVMHQHAQLYGLFNPGRGRHFTRTNEEMVSSLKMNGSLVSDTVSAAFLAVPRGSFVPAEYADEAYLDSPLRLEELEFNISAPHMHAMSLEALDLQPGQRVLDIGCGCGIVSALVALLVGASGTVVGIDVLHEAVQLSKSNLARLALDSEPFASAAASCAFQQHNAFLPGAALSAGFDRIYVGAACPETRLGRLAKLLLPGGKMIVPVGSQLRLITRVLEGQSLLMLEEVLTQVRFGDLVVPSDARIVLETLKMEHEQQCAVPLLGSTLGDDMVEASGGSRSSEDSAQSTCGADVAGLGAHDCALRCSAAGWRLPAHRAMLKVRCQHFRARFDSGMRDADAAEFEVPDIFSKETIQAFLHYVYFDALMPGLSGPEVAHLVHAAAFFSAQRLITLCEAALAAELQAEGEDGAADLALQLLMLADDVNLPHLRSVALNYITHNYAAAAASPHFSALTQPQTALIAQAACSCYMRTLTALKEVAGPCHDGMDDSQAGPGCRAGFGCFT